MTPTRISATDFLRLFFSGIVCTIAVGFVLGLVGSELLMGPGSPFWTGAVVVPMLAATTLAVATPISAPALLLWLRLSRTFPTLESKRWVTVVGLTVLSAFLSVIVGFAYRMKNVQPGETVQSSFHDLLSDVPSLVSFFLYFFIWSVAPRLTLARFKRPLYL